ncbi:hypothetical protein HMPREF9123_1851 [Neisseria bacilliformis ATCC BAA-1200]|uniref:Uncharacterized protein n=1 Tax=Neisseria bacilliformis ATCC BAA-1200 TaxID=888742 RepID=F2BDN7_9NEIS|nr:hypothetical protein [Neisseria bacilliformis]EGF10443.1 hypothetical protein HMPREF9123_1851 [Neisseria bacilliformis ATCC BAA-1200]QMT46636.1 hypothetical protein H3L91_06605 [Neisseria bacilliformis]
MQITTLQPANLETVIEHLIFRIRAASRARNAARSFGWLFVHGFEEGAAFEFGAGAAVSDPQLPLEYETGGEIWDYADAYENKADDEVPGARELEGVYEWSEADWRLQEGEERGEITLQSGTWQIISNGTEWQTVGFTAENEADNVFSQHVYRRILAEAARRYPDEIQGFVLEMHDSALPRLWIDAAAPD